MSSTPEGLRDLGWVPGRRGRRSASFPKVAGQQASSGPGGERCCWDGGGRPRHAPHAPTLGPCRAVLGEPARTGKPIGEALGILEANATDGQACPVDTWFYPVAVCIAGGEDTVPGLHGHTAILGWIEAHGPPSGAFRFGERI